MVKRTYDLGELPWRLGGFQPHAWRFESEMTLATTTRAEVPALHARVPGSVQQALLDAGRLPDWNVGLNAEQCEWVENRHWVYETALPDAWLTTGAIVRLRCLGLDGNGSLWLNGRELLKFDNSFVPHIVDLTPHLRASDNRLQIIFACPPRWLGQFGYTSRMRAWKPRFNYHWDWTARLVQIGIWDKIELEVVEGGEIASLRVTTDAEFDPAVGKLQLSGVVRGEGATLRCGLTPTEGRGGPQGVREQTLNLSQTADATGSVEFTLLWQDLEVDLWWPNGYGEQPLYELSVELLDAGGAVVDRAVRRVGFKHVEWRPCAGSPDDADPWLCVINGREVFLQGFNWTPIRPNFADLDDPAYEQRLRLYRDLHVTVLRVWGGAVLEREVFYDLCDELGLLVWQEFPLSSSGIDNYAPDDAESIATLTAIARSYITRRQHHASLFVWCGGNELMNDRVLPGQPDAQRSGSGEPLGLDHPTLAALGEVVRELDPTRRYLPTSASGPSFSGDAERYGQGVHWDVHGPWQVEGALDAAWEAYWRDDDALMRSEVGAPGPSSADLVRRYAGDLVPFPGTLENPLWRRTSWWIEWSKFVAEMGREPETLEAYVAWGQERQARVLATAAAACKDRFPRCGGFIVWMGHDSFPCAANTAVIDFEGNPKPAAFALAGVFGR